MNGDVETAVPGSGADVPTLPTVRVDGPAVEDWGRIVMVPLGVLLAGLSVLRVGTLLGRPDGTHDPVATAAQVVTALVVLAFYAVMAHAYLRRGAALATTDRPLALLAAPVATFLPFALPFTASGGAPAVVTVLGDLLLVGGLTFSVWSLRCLDRSLSVVPQARTLVQHGPYARVRHPLYTGELVAMLGLALTLGGYAPLGVWAALVCLQGYRAVKEEQLLSARLPGYASYRSRTARILPGLF